MRLVWLPDVLRAAGLDVVTVDGWRERGRDFKVDRLAGIVNHHTASKPGRDVPSLSTCIRGNTVAPGPLCQVLIARSGRVYVVAAGVANHAGKGAHAPFGPSANDTTLGIEAENDGVGEVWPRALITAMVAVNAAVLAHEGLGADRALMHREWAPGRKPDPRGPWEGGGSWDDPTVFRAMVAARITEEGELSAEDRARIDKLELELARLAFTVEGDGGLRVKADEAWHDVKADDKGWTVAGRVTTVEQRLAAIEQRLADLVGAVGELRSLAGPEGSSGSGAAAEC